MSIPSRALLVCLFALAVAAFMPSDADAQSGTVFDEYEDQTLMTYSEIPGQPGCVEIVHASCSDRYAYDLTINGTVFHDGIMYQVVSIGSEAFRGSEWLENLVVPSSVTGIGDRAFYGCTRLSQVSFSGTLSSVGDYVFTGTKVTSFTVNQDMVSEGPVMLGLCIGAVEVSQDMVPAEGLRVEFSGLPQGSTPQLDDKLGFATVYRVSAQGWDGALSVQVPAEFAPIGYRGCDIYVIQKGLGEMDLVAFEDDGSMLSFGMSASSEAFCITPKVWDALEDSPVLAIAIAVIGTVLVLIFLRRE